MQGFAFLLSCLLSFVDPPDSPPAVHYSFTLFNKKNEKIGDIKTTKTVNGNETIYESETNMTVKVLVKQVLYYHIKATYKNGMLTESYAYSTLNKKPRSNCHLVWKENKYEISKDSSNYTIGHAISYSGAMLYFKEPPVNGTFFSELNGYESDIAKLAEGQYQMTDAKTKKQNKYYYKSGSLDNAYINHTFLDVIVRRTK